MADWDVPREALFARDISQNIGDLHLGLAVNDRSMQRVGRLRQGQGLNHQYSGIYSVNVLSASVVCLSAHLRMPCLCSKLPVVHIL